MIPGEQWRAACLGEAVHARRALRALIGTLDAAAAERPYQEDAEVMALVRRRVLRALDELDRASGDLARPTV